VPPRRKRVWARNDEVISAVPAGGTAIDLLSDFFTAYGTTNAPPGVTIGGVLLDLSVVQTNARASSTDDLKFGIIVASESTAAQVPVPSAEPHADWMWYQSIPAPGAAAGASFSTAQALGGPIRIRARRRMDELGMRLWFVADSNGLTAYDLLVSTSVLLIMP
jgi:hypothetical protein